MESSTSDTTLAKPTVDLTGGHTVRRYDQELAKLRSIILQMGERVIDQTQAAVAALIEEDESQAYRVLDREPLVDYLSLDADEEVFRVIARRQPTAVDLRIVLALSKIAGEVERAGDKAARIARQALELRQQETDGVLVTEALREAFQALDDKACCMFERSVHAVTTFDVTQALAIFENEPALYAAAQALREQLSASGSDGLVPRQAITLFHCAQALKHIGSHASNIAEQVIYVALGQDVRYRNREILIETLRHHGY
ncbi:phosphate transport system protein [Allochromatium warmingii]|uniref:Phosphate transport system protein n=1 Tax=Allochromatium warmingii TaxID=61595 RepID=A0A1H3BL05_ALLWA|nr:phosphate signaling complex protein PhoU [Allochromatium warmingii]SDX42004.1 phosphate transport system protein [Allochromatium warmingii]